MTDDQPRSRKGGRPTIHPGERMTAVAAVRMTKSELSEIEARAAAAGSSLSNYMRASVRLNFEQSARPAPVAADPATRHELAAIGNNLNQIARKFHVNGEVAPEPLNEALTQLRAVLNTFGSP